MGSRRLRSLLVRAFGGGGSPTFVMDETLERRWGRHTSKRGHHRDPLACSRKWAASTSGLRRIVLTLGSHADLHDALLALPVLSVPATTPQVSERLGFGLLHPQTPVKFVQSRA